MTVFYADDDRDDIDFFIDAIAEVNNDVKAITCNDGKSLLNLLNNSSEKPFIVFLDWNMPGKDGADVLKEIRQNAQTSCIPVAILSTSNSKEHIAAARLFGANYFITKPNSFKELVQAIKHCLNINWAAFKADEKEFHYNTNV